MAPPTGNEVHALSEDELSRLRDQLPQPNLFASYESLSASMRAQIDVTIEEWTITDPSSYDGTKAAKSLFNGKNSQQTSRNYSTDFSGMRTTYGLDTWYY